MNDKIITLLERLIYLQEQTIIAHNERIRTGAVKMIKLDAGAGAKLDCDLTDNDKKQIADYEITHKCKLFGCRFDKVNNMKIATLKGGDLEHNLCLVSEPPVFIMNDEITNKVDAAIDKIVKSARGKK